jgi:Predicted nucleic-acid-binding protein, contains PIN domain
MQDDCFADSNVLLYTLDKPSKKREIAFDLWRQGMVISTQVIMEFTNICIKKFNFSRKDAFQNARNIIESASVKSVTKETIHIAFELSEKHGFSHWDSLILASALEAKCKIIYTEDLKDGQLINGRLRIINPFKI